MTCLYHNRDTRTHNRGNERSQGGFLMIQQAVKRTWNIRFDGVDRERRKEQGEKWKRK